MTLRFATILVLLSACDDVNTGIGVGPRDTGPDTGNGGIDTSIEDTTDTDEDQDDDGFSPSAGDCDDADPRVSPARDEDGSDEKDNDCDGKINEEFTGVDVAWVESSGAGHVLTIDKIGRIAADVPTGACVPFFLDHVVRDGQTAADEWIINDSLAGLARVTADGTCTPLADFSDTEVYEYPPYGVTVTPDGAIYVVFTDQFGTVAEDGTYTQLATWDPEADFLGIGLANDPKTGQVGIFDMLGGFATWDATSGFVIEHAPNFEAPELSTVSGSHGDDGSWYVPAVSAAGYGVYGFNPASSAWEMQDQWTDEDWAPFMLAVDGSDPKRMEFYVTATAGAFQTVWRIIHGTNHADDLYASDGTDFGNYYGIVADDGAGYAN